MLWVLYTLLSAFSWATADAFTKKVSDVDDYIIVLSRFLYGAPFVLLLLFFIPIPKLESIFWIILVIDAAIQTAAWILYVKAIRISPMSLVTPFIALTPVFLVFTSFIMLNELPTIVGFFGILMVVSGAYILNLDNSSKSILGPFRAIFKEKGCVYMIIAAFLFSITANFSKVLVQESSPLFYSALYLPLYAIPLLIVSFFVSRKSIVQLKSNFRSLFPIGLFFGFMAIFHNLAITLVIVPYMMSIKRTSSIFGVLYGWLLFKEKNIPIRLIGAVVMLIGAGLIILF